MEAFTYENIYYDDCSIRYSFYLPKPVSKRIKASEYVFRVMSASGLILCLVYIFFIKEISPLQIATTDEKNGFDESRVRMLHTAKCGLQTSWENVLLRSSGVINITDWSFKTKTGCPVFPSLTPLKSRKKLVLECDDGTGTLRYVTTGNTSNVFTIPFKDIYLTNCLGDVIDICCMRNGEVVPNVVHYAWYSYKELGFFPFLSFMSVLRFIRPCLILIHGSYLPFGKYWDYFISIAPNVIHVKMESPTSAFGHNQNFQEHSIDSMRTEALTAYGGIYLDYDGIILRPLTPLMKYYNTLAQFLRLWYQRYKDNYREEWGLNALNFHTDLERKRLILIHVEGYNFTRSTWKEMNLIFNKNYDWSISYAIHLFIRRDETEMTLQNIRQLNTTIGSVSRYILLGNKDMCQD